MLKHANCGAAIVMDLNSAYSIVSDGLKITQRGIDHAGAEIRASAKKGAFSFKCISCEETIAGKEQYETQIKCACSICHDDVKPSEAFVLSGGLLLCTKCKEILVNKKPSSNDPIIYQYVRNMDIGDVNITILTLLMKHK